jgi:hypothetical protein
MLSGKPDIQWQHNPAPDIGEALAIRGPGQVLAERDVWQVLKELLLDGNADPILRRQVRRVEPCLAQRVETWQTVADTFAPAAGAGNYAFNDVQAMMAFVGAGRRDLAEAVLAAQREAMIRDDDNAGFTREVGHALAQAILAFGDFRYREVVALIRPVRSIAHRFGGSHAQRDVIDLTLLEAALRSGDRDLAAALAAGRVAAKPSSPLALLFARRAAEPAPT